MKKLKIMLLALTVSSMAFAAGGLVACNVDDGGNQGGNTGDEQSQYTMKITAIGSTTIQVSRTLTLRTQVTGTNQKDVTWSSLNPDIATVSDRGVVTGVSEGEATIKAVLDIDEKCSATIKVKVEPAVAPETLTVTGAPEDNTGWVGETAQLGVNVTPDNASLAVTWTSSDDSVASVSEDGVVTFKKKGSVTVTATSKADDTKKDSVTLNVREGVFNTKMGANWDFSHQDSETDAYIVAQTENMAKEKINTAYFANYRGTRFYVEATFTEWAETANAWDWQGFGLGAGLADNDARYFTYSHHYSGNTANNFNKFIVRDNPNSWGAITTRSQTWGARDLNSIKLGEDLKIGMLRDGNDYYYFLNDELYYFDYFTKYNNEATIPFIVTMDMAVKAVDYKLVTDAAQIDAKIAACDKSFYAVNNNAEYVNDAEFTFKNKDCFSKDHQVHSIGDKAILMNSFEIEFDVDSLVFGGSGQRYKGLSVNLTRYDSADIVDTLGIGVAKGADSKGDGSSVISRFFQWNYPEGAAGSSLAKWFETSQPIFTDAAAKHHIKITRTVDADAQKSYFRIYVDGEEYMLDTGKKGDVAVAETDYIGSYIIWVSGEYASAHVTNFKYESNVSNADMLNTLSITTAKSSLEVKDTLQLEAIFSNASTAQVTYVSLNPSVATVSASGLVTALTHGEALIVATATVDGVTVKATKKITVEEPATLKILNTETELWPNETITVRYEFSKDTAHTVVFESSNNNVATVNANGVVSPVADGRVTITVRDAVNGDIFDMFELEVITALKLKITNTMLYIETGATEQLGYKFTYDAGHSVKFESSDPSKATVSDTGLITAKATGDVTITVTSATDSSITASATFHIVNPLSLEITNESSEMYLTGTLQITHQFSYPAGHSVSYLSSDEDKATVSETGLVTAKATGNVTITVKDEDSELTDTITLNINDIVIDHTYQSDMWDYSGLASDTPSITTVGETPDGKDYVAVFKNVRGQRYYAEATVSITNYKNFVWAGIGLGNKAEDSDAVRSIILSSSPDAANRPIIIKDGIDDWGGLANDSQVHHWKGLASTVRNNSIKLGLVRDGNDYYYFVNGVLVYLDANDAIYNGTDTSPVIRLLEVHGTVTGIYATTESSVIDAKLGLNDGDKKFASFNPDVVEVKDNGDIQFKNANLNSIDGNKHVIKDYVAMANGAGYKLAGGKDTKVEFDVKFDSFGADDSGMLGMLLRDCGAGQYLNSRAFLIGKSWFGFNAFSFGGNMDVNTSAKTNMPTEIDMTTGTHHVVIERRSTGYTIIIDGNATVASWNYDSYANDMQVSFSGTTAAGTVSNITVSDI